MKKPFSAFRKSIPFTQIGILSKISPYQWDPLSTSLRIEYQLYANQEFLPLTNEGRCSRSSRRTILYSPSTRAASKRRLNQFCREHMTRRIRGRVWGLRASRSMIISKVCTIITFPRSSFDVVLTCSSKIKISTSRVSRKPVRCRVAGRMKPALTLSNALSTNYGKLPT